MDHFKAASNCAYICFRSAGGKLEKALYKCTTLLLLLCTNFDISSFSGSYFIDINQLLDLLRSQFFDTSPVL